MKLLKTIVILILVVGLPALSWYYLSQGADWRMQGIEAMATKTPVDLTLDTGFLTARDELKSERTFTIAVKYPVTDEAQLERLNLLADQFSYRDDLVMLYHGGVNANLADEWTASSCEDEGCADLFATLFPEGMNAALVDDSSYLRRSYDINTQEGMNTLIEHAAILFPVEKRAKLELKRGSIK